MRHELNNLLQVICTQLELIALRVGADPDVGPRVAAALDAVGRAHRLLGDEPPDGSALPGGTARPPLPRIVVIEDDALVRMTIAAVLTDLGYAVTASGSAADAMTALAPGADVLITDLNLPDGSGEDLADEAVALQPGLAVVIASGEQRPESSNRVWLRKPFNSARLQAAIEAALRAA